MQRTGTWLVFTIAPHLCNTGLRLYFDWGFFFCLLMHQSPKGGCEHEGHVPVPFPVVPAELDSLVSLFYMFLQENEDIIRSVL